MLTQREIEEKAYDILELVEMENKLITDVIILTKRYGFTVKNATFSKEDITIAVKIMDNNKIIYIKKDLPIKAKKILITRAFAKYMLEKKSFILHKNDNDIDSERLARALLIRKEIFLNLVHMSLYIGKPLHLIEKELVSTFGTTRSEIKHRLSELKKI